MSYDPYWQQPHQPGGPVPRQRTPAWPYAVLAVSLVLFVAVCWWVYDSRIKTDSGIAACEALRDGSTVAGAPVDTKADGKMTETQYLKLRGIFKDSRYADIRTAGTKLMDVLWQVTQLGPNPGLEAFAYVGQMMSAVTDMQGACANHGIVLDLASKLTPSPTTTALPALGGYASIRPPSSASRSSASSIAERSRTASTTAWTA